ncbi:MAG: BRO family protein [bacterium]|nr:BRO family protein [bacterium]
MEATHLKVLYKTLDDIRHENGKEYWYARELFPILGYTRWESFVNPINKAKEACKNAGGNIPTHFQDSPKMVKIGLDLEKPIADIKLTRYACYLIAINGNPRKEEVAFAQAYFVTRTREIEVLEQSMWELERIDARDKLKVTEKDFADIAFSRGVDGKGIA